MYLLSLKGEGTSVFQNYFDSALLTLISAQQISDFGTQTKKFVPVVNVKSLSVHDVINRDNQFKAITNYQCNGHPNIYSNHFAGYCMPGVLRHGVFNETTLGFEEAQGVIENYYTNTTEHDFRWGKLGQLTGVSLLDKFIPCDFTENNCPTYLTYNPGYGDETRLIVPVSIYNFENSGSPCPSGTIFDSSASGWFGGKEIQVCVPSYLKDDISVNYTFGHVIDKFPLFEVYPDNKVRNHPYPLNNTKKTIPYVYYPDVLIYGGQFLSYTKTIDQNVSAVISFNPLVSENAFLISRTVNGLKLLRKGNIEVPLIIRDILKFSNDFKLIERDFSFVTQDGFDIGVGVTALSPKTYGILGKTIAQQFGILTLATDVVVPEEKKEGDGGVVPCGLAKDVQVLKTRKNAEGKDENYFETQRSPPCVTNWGKAPTGKNVKDFKQLCPKEGEEGYDPKCKESDFFKDSLKKLMDNFSLDSDSFKIKDVTSTKCVPLKLDFAGAGNWLGGGGVHDIKIICEVFEKSPTLETLFRTFFMITWFVTALFKLLSA